MKKLLLTFALLLGTLSAAFAQEVLTTDGIWGKVSGYGNNAADKSVSSSSSFLGTTWTSFGLANNSGSWTDYRCGSKNAAVVAYITNDSPVEAKITKFVLNTTIQKTGTNDKLNSMKLLVANNNDFTGATEIAYTNTTTSGDWAFEIPDNAQGYSLYYKFVFDCPKSTNNGFLAINKISAYSAGDTREKVELSFPETQYSVPEGEAFESPAIICSVDAAKSEIVYTSSNEDVATVAADGKVTIVGKGSTEIKAEITGSENYYDAVATYLLTVYDPNELSLVFPNLNLNNSAVLTEYEVGPVTFSFAQGTNTSNGPKYFTSNSTGRVYVNNTITITVEQGYFLRSIRFEDASDKAQSAIGTTATNGTLSSGVWTAAGKYFRTTKVTVGGSAQLDHIIVIIEAETDMDPEDFTHSSFKNYVIEPDETVEFTFPEYAPEITFSSSDEDVIVVEGNTLKAIASGEATITASWEATEIWKAGSAEFTVNVTGLFEDPEFSVDVETVQVGSTALVLVNEGDQLNIPITYVGGDDPEFTVVSSNEEVAVATISADKKSVNVDVKKRGRAVLTLSVGACGNYDPAEITINIQGCYHDLASILENAVENELYYGTFPITVALDNDMYNYVTDGTAWALFYVDHSHGDGAVIPAGWYAKYTIYNGLPEFTEIEHVEDEDITDNEPIQFKEYSTEELTEEMANEVLILNDVEFTEDTPSAVATNFTGTFAGIEYTFRNTLGKEGVKAGVYNLKAAIGLYKAKNQSKATLQIYPIEYMAQAATTAPTAKFRTYADGEALEFEGLEEGAHIYYRHGGEDPDHNNVFTESAAEVAPRRAAEFNTDWTYNHTTHPLTFQSGVSMNVKYIAKKSGKAPSEVQALSVDGGGVTTGLDNVVVGEGEAVYYNLQGVRVANPENGVFVRILNGKAEKVMVK